MQKFYSIVLMAVALLIGTNVKAVGVSSFEDLKTLIEAAQDQQTIEIELEKDIEHLADATDGTKSTTTKAASNLLNGELMLHGTIHSGLYSITYKKEQEILIANGQNVVLDLQGHDLKSAEISKNLFRIDHGHLTIKSTKGGVGNVINRNEGGAWVTINKVDDQGNVIKKNGDTLAVSPKNGYAVQLYGKKTNDIQGWYSWLTVEENVNLIGHASGATINSLDKTMAYGAYIEIKSGAYVAGGKYGVQVSGNVKAPTDESFAYNPKISIAEGAEVTNTDAQAVYASGVYAGGYANTTIDGYVHGATGVYAKSGNVEITGNAQISSDATTYTEAAGRNSGTAASGSAIVMDSNKAYAGSMTLEVSGNAQITGNGGYAVESTITTADNNEVEGVTISGGTFTSGDKGCMDVAPVIADDAANIKIDGGDFDNKDQINAVLAATGEEHFLSQTTDKEGNIIYVVTTNTTGEKLADNKNIDITANTTIAEWEDKVGELAADANMTYLALTGNSHLTIPAGRTMKVGTNVMTANAKVTVQSGAKLVITGTNGLVANEISNIIIEAAEGNMGQLLISPATEIHYNPAATVQFVSKSYYVSSTDRRNQRFGIPTIGAVTSISAKLNNVDIPTAFMGYENGIWKNLGTINNGTSFDFSKLSTPFAYYQMSNNTPNAGTVVTMTGNLVGNASPSLDVPADQEWVTFANSYMANMSMAKMFSMFDGKENDFSQTVYSYTPTSDNTFAWDPFNIANFTLFGESRDVQPMQAFIVQHMNTTANQLNLDYSEMVWKPSEESNALKPARKQMAMDVTTARIYLSAANGIQDHVSIVAGNQFSEAFDNGFDAEKIMNNTLDLYTVGIKNMSTLATDNLNNTLLGFSCAEAGEYTISFSHLNGDNLTLVDRQTGARVDMVEGSTYSFHANANSTDNGRFMIIGSKNAPTGVENIADTTTKGAIYTIMGQYVGSVENWNALPAGVYVVDGVKCVK